ncbi:PilZ domain-containing protein [Vitiosangium sp. GDMCC 1.1324]|uniref:PilZ domain-containing protein n=1 Tax=Vitiosangium sp. (strain GDMCC 1.1324) TaxID=2138576 RepID=UPI000D35479D|nr:PilZ domain-containing protein [Vitiosangium sp. GDMCC 1.1324]PTL83202.1 pilus assembly protein PilZ [Vitiosangium sp. GDMCC 1.1324]
MSANLWVENFRALHARARKGQLPEEEKRRYMAAREQFARALTAAQGMSLPPSQSARRTFRIAQGLQVDLSFATGPIRAMTLDVSVGGFSVMMHKPPVESEEPGFTLRLPGNLEPVKGRVKMVSVQRKIGTHRVSFAIQGLSDKDAERLETALFDLALERIK